MRSPLVWMAIVGSTCGALACAGGRDPKAPATTASSSVAAAAPSESASTSGATPATPPAIVEDSKEAWFEEDSASLKPGEKGTLGREFRLDVTKHTEWKKGGSMVEDAGPPPPDRVFRVTVRFPVPKVVPSLARDAHVVNRALWDVRSEIAKCFYKGPGREGTAEQAMVGFLQVDKTGVVKAGGVEAADPALKKSGADQCILENVKGVVLGPAGDDVKLRFKLKLQTVEVTGKTDVKSAK